MSGDDLNNVRRETSGTFRNKGKGLSERKLEVNSKTNSETYEEVHM
jgi:hypothetical protein